MYFYTLLLAVCVIVAIFLTPLRHKVWVATGAVALSAIGAITLAIMAFANGPVTLAEFHSPLFGNETIVVDKLTSLFLVIISVASITTTIYSKG